MKDNAVLRFLNKMTDLFVLNLLFVVCSIPLVTIGASLCGMYGVSLRSVRYGDGYVVSEFFRSFKKSFKQATLVWLIDLLFVLLLLVDIRFYTMMPNSPLAMVMLAVSMGLAMVVAVISMWAFPLITKMEDPLVVQIRNAAAMAVGYFIPYTLLCAGLTVAIFGMAMVNTGFLLFLFIGGFATLSYIQSFFFYKVFSKHITEDSLGEDDLLYQNHEES